MPVSIPRRFCIVLSFLPLMSFAQDREPAEKPVLKALRVEQGPKVDGRLDDPVWQEASPARKLYRYEPRAGSELSERTEFRFVYDEENLYLGVWCYDRNPDGIIARSMVRDGSFSSDDYLYMMFDTFHDLRSGYVFVTNPLGMRYDSLVSAGSNTNSNWDGVWEVKTSIDDEGWKAEFRFPFNTLSFDPENDRWGFNMSRNVRRKSERGRWTGALPHIRTSMPAEAGDLVGLEGMKQGLGLEFSPYVVGRYREEQGDTDWLGDAGFDVRYRITPNLSATFSYNTDFAETEVDDRQVNLTRFPLFFPEKRAFFLEDSGIYDFGGLTTSRRSRLGLRNLLVPYFTRRIGLSDDGEIVPILFADKVAGRIGNYEIGFTHAMLEDHGEIDRKNVFAGRLVRHFGEQSSLGLLTTVGDPNSEGDNYMLGADYRFRTSNFGSGDQFIQADLFALATRQDGTEDDGSGHAYGVSVTYPNEPLYVGARAIEIGENFDPALGFVRRHGVRGYTSYARYRHRPEDSPWLRAFAMSLKTEHFTNLDNELESAEYRMVPFEIEFASADELSFSITHEIDNPHESFEIFDDVIIPAGDYSWTDYSLELVMARKRDFAAEIQLTYGDFYDGEHQEILLETLYLPNKHIAVGLDYAYNRVDLPEGEFHTHLAAARMWWKFTPDLTWTHLLQYDSISESIGFQSVLQWEYRPGSKVFAVINQSYLDEDGRGYRQESQEFALKLGANIRF